MPDVVVCKCPTIFQLLSGEYKPLLQLRNTLLLVDFVFEDVNRVRKVNVVERYRLTRQVKIMDSTHKLKLKNLPGKRSHKDLHERLVTVARWPSVGELNVVSAIGMGCSIETVVADFSTVMERGLVELELLGSVADESFWFDLFLDIVDQLICAYAEEGEEGATVFFKLE